MILVTIAVLMADTTPLTSTDTVTAVGEHTQLMMTQNKYCVINLLLLLLNSPITVDPQWSTDYNTVGDCEQLHTDCTTIEQLGIILQLKDSSICESPMQ